MVMLESVLLAPLEIIVEYEIIVVVAIVSPSSIWKLGVVAIVASS